MDFLAIGDTVVDDFIRLKDAKVTCDIDNEHCTITMRWGDKIPFEFSKVIYGVGNAANGAVAAARLGLKTGFISNVGGDDRGAKILEQFKKEGIATDYVKVHEGKPTNYHYVLWYESERTILIKHEEYDCTLPSPAPSAKAVYLSSLSEHCVDLHDDIARWLEHEPTTLFAFQPGTFQIKAGVERLKRIYKRTDIFTANKEEYQRILGTAEDNEKKLLEMMRSKGPHTCLLTDGMKGAYGMSNAGSWKIGTYPDPTTPVDRTGAGDAFASTTTIALLLGKPLPEAMQWGPINSMSVAQYVGAQEGLLSREKIEAHLKDAPPDYKAMPF